MLHPSDCGAPVPWNRTSSYASRPLVVWEVERAPHQQPAAAGGQHVPRQPVVAGHEFLGLVDTANDRCSSSFVAPDNTGRAALQGPPPAPRPGSRRGRSRRGRRRPRGWSRSPRRLTSTAPRRRMTFRFFPSLSAPRVCVTAGTSTGCRYQPSTLSFSASARLDDAADLLCRQPHPTGWVPVGRPGRRQCAPRTAPRRPGGRAPSARTFLRVPGSGWARSSTSSGSPRCTASSATAIAVREGVEGHGRAASALAMDPRYPVYTK